MVQMNLFDIALIADNKDFHIISLYFFRVQIGNMLHLFQTGQRMIGQETAHNRTIKAANGMCLSVSKIAARCLFGRGVYDNESECHHNESNSE